MVAKYELEKRVWTEADFGVMGWHDATIHSVAFFPETFEFALDLDYIFQWVSPEKEDGLYYSFWVAPVTMVFDNVYDLCLDIETSAGINIDCIHRNSPARPRNAEAIGRDTEWSWSIECQEGCIDLKAVGYKMYVRQEPTLQREQSLGLEARGGISFERNHHG